MSPVASITKGTNTFADTGRLEKATCEVCAATHAKYRDGSIYTQMDIGCHKELIEFCQANSRVGMMSAVLLFLVLSTPQVLSMMTELFFQASQNQVALFVALFILTSTGRDSVTASVDLLLLMYDCC